MHPYLIHRLRCRWPRRRSLCCRPHRPSSCVRVAAAALRFLPPPLSTRALFRSSSLNSSPRRRFLVAPSPASRQSYRCATTRSRVATPAVILSRFAPARCPSTVKYTTFRFLGPRRFTSSRRKFQLPSPLSAWPLRVGLGRRLLLLRSFSACVRAAASFRALPRARLPARRCPQTVRPQTPVSPHPHDFGFTITHTMTRLIYTLDFHE